MAFQIRSMTRGTKAIAVPDSASITLRSRSNSVASMIAVALPVTALFKKPNLPSRWLRLRTITNKSSGLLTMISPPLVMFDSRLSCVRMTPFGSPVEPEVYMIVARSFPCTDSRMSSNRSAFTRRPLSTSS